MKNALAYNYKHEKFYIIETRGLCCKNIIVNYLMPTFLGLKYCGKLLWYYNSDTMGQCYKTFNHGKLVPFYIIYCGNIVL